MPNYTELKTLLDIDEPDYAQMTVLVGTAEIPHLRSMIQNEPADLAAKATSLAGMLSGPDAVTLLETALGRPEVIVRIAAAAYLGARPPDAVAALLRAALADTDDQVRFVVLDRWNADRMPPDDVLDDVVNIWEGDAFEHVRDAADVVLRSLRRVDSYCGNRTSREIHRIRNITAQCQLDEIKRFRPYVSLQSAQREDYDNCAYCIGGSTR